MLLAKQAATLDAISDGRLALGIGVGWRDDDFRATGTQGHYAERGAVIERQIELMRRVWSGASSATDSAGRPRAGAAGPRALARRRRTRGAAACGPPRRRLLRAPGAGRRSGEAVRRGERWRARRGALGPPRLVAPRYFALGDDVRAAAEANVRTYYGIAGDDFVRTCSPAS